ncbi:sporulation integral membrane protein YtvI [Ructibacterium gallinarum]|uniref:Sporulation integral membrane protein YtvI n=1 Tax=Ructibacterium gallinarum TaxID=2779355 RepID=A0A9D5M248_9FIRM|nr:sporulation integral membrane protein YtvI [Ructibacterium gallinarum]MBE5040058.1 sporulation integral membrane protein YtvI [Ructibacterium gallinarum]
MDLNQTEKRRKFIIDIVYFAIILCLVFLFLKYAVSWIMPFLLGFLIALMFRPLIKAVSGATRMNKKFCAFVIVLLGYTLLGFLLWLLGNALFQSLKDFCLNLPSLYTNEIGPALGTANQNILDFAKRFSPDIADQVGKTLSDMLDGIQSSLGELSAKGLSALAGASTKLPLMLISLIFTILSSLFISIDYDNVLSFIKRQIPEKRMAILTDVRDYLGKTLASYARAYLILMGITFIELSVGLLALRVNNALGIAAGIAVADALPVLGTGTILIPWTLIALLQQRYYLALGLILLYLIVTVIRHFIEPKVVGDQLGLPPIVTIICIYLGFVWFGVLGAILFPVTMNIIICLHRAGKIHIWK